MTINVRIKHDEPNNENSIRVTTVDKDGNKQSSMDIHPGQEGVFYVYSSQDIHIEELKKDNVPVNVDPVVADTSASTPVVAPVETPAAPVIVTTENFVVTDVTPVVDATPTVPPVNVVSAAPVVDVVATASGDVPSDEPAAPVADTAPIPDVTIATVTDGAPVVDASALAAADSQAPATA